jgi:hypothetical protein
MVPPVHQLPGVSVKRGGPQVRSPGCPTCLSVPAFTLASPQRLTCPRQRSFEPVSKTGIRASYTRTPREEFPVLLSRFPAAFRPPGICFPGHPVLQGSSAPLTVGLRHRLRIPAPAMQTHSRVSTFRTRETRTGPGALYPGNDGVRWRRKTPQPDPMPLADDRQHPH